LTTSAATLGPLAIMGGAFDPVHYGHLRTAFELYQRLNFAEVRFIPSANPPHRPPHIAAAGQRLELLQAATAGLSWCAVDDRELRRAGPSWSVLTLEELRAESGGRSLCMILGMDAFLGLPDWHRWEELLGLAHLVVAHRPGWTPPRDGVLGDLLHVHGTGDAALLQQEPAGSIYVQEVTQLEISSSAIRSLLGAGISPEFLLPASVIDMINSTGCYGNAG
jgi:nicotinate-nucleotide adenylyltransferase